MMMMMIVEQKMIRKGVVWCDLFNLRLPYCRALRRALVES